MKERFLFALQRSIGSCVAQRYLELQSLSASDPAAVRTHAEMRLDYVLQFAQQRVNFYRERVPGNGRCGLRDFPILTRANLVNSFRQLMADDLRQEYDGRRPRGYSWVEVKTGGSTGVPVAAIHDADFRDRGRAARLFSQYLCGFPVPTPYFRLWGSMKDINGRKSSRTQRVMAWLSNEHLMNAFRMTPQDMDAYLDEINRLKIDYMMAYADAAYELGSYAIAAGKRVRPLKAVMLCAATVTPTMRQAVTDGLHARAHNKYGTRECADIACECEQGGLHIYSPFVHLEVVSDAGEPLPVGSFGRLLVTILSNRRFPLIRYDIGDMAALSNDRCACGSAFPLLRSLEGRAVEMLTSASGAYVTPAFVIHLIGVEQNPGWIKKFQLIQNGAGEFELRMVVAPSVAEAEFCTVRDRITADLREVLGGESRIHTVRTDEIPLTQHGKHLYTINRTRRSTVEARAERYD